MARAFYDPNGGAAIANFSSLNRKMPRLRFHSSFRRSIQFPFKELFRPSFVRARVVVCLCVCVFLCVRRAINQNKTRRTVEARSQLQPISVKRTKPKANVMSLGDNAPHGFTRMPATTRKGENPKLIVTFFIYRVAFFLTILFQFVNKHFANVFPLPVGQRFLVFSFIFVCFISCAARSKRRKPKAS